MLEFILFFIIECITVITYYFVIFYKLLLLIMQTIFYFNCWYYFPFIKPFLLFLSPYININIQQGIIEIPSLISYPKPILSEFLELFDKLNFSKESAIKKNYNLDLELFTNQYDLNNLINDYFEFIIVYIWVFFPIILYIGLIYFLHGLLGLYSAYVDYFQKNSDQVKTLRGALPALFIFYFLIFIIFVLLFFFFNLYLIYILWFVYI